MTCFLVLGTPRSGTSVTAGILHHLGIDMGSDHKKPSVEWCPTGSFEANRWSSAIVAMQEGCPIGARVFGYLVGYRQGECQGKDWGLKCPKLMSVLQEFFGLFPSTVCGSLRTIDCKAIFTERDLRNSQASLVNLRPELPAVDCRLGIKQLFDAIPAARNMADNWNVEHITVNFDTLIDDTKNTVERIAAFCNRSVTPAALALVRKEHRHYE